MAEVTGIGGHRQAHWNERFHGHWGLEGASTLQFGRRFNAWRHPARRTVFRRAVRRPPLIPGAFSVLDVASGTGFHLRQWQSPGADSIAAVDNSDWALGRLARAYPNPSLFHADISGAHVPLPAGAFDAVSAIDGLTHILDDAAYLRALGNIHRSLKPGGWLRYSGIFLHGPDNRFGHYWRGRSLSPVAAAMDATGFEIVSRSPFPVLMRAPTDPRRRERNERMWEVAMLPFLRREWTGFLCGALLYPIELVLVGVLDESPAVELRICRKWNPGA